MYASSEKRIIKKDFITNYFDRINLWSYMDKKDFRRQITFKWLEDKKKYYFTFPMNNREYNYAVYFESHKEAEEYIKFILNDYLE